MAGIRWVSVKLAKEPSCDIISGGGMGIRGC